MWSAGAKFNVQTLDVYLQLTSAITEKKKKKKYLNTFVHVVRKRKRFNYNISVFFLCQVPLLIPM